MLLCFDYDGVLVDSLPQQLAVLSAAQAQLRLGRPPQERDFADVEDLSYEGFARHIGVSDDALPLWKDTVIKLLLQDRTKVPLFVGMREALLELSTRFPCIIITSNIREAVERLLSQESCSHAIQEIYDGKARGTKGDKIKAAAQKFGIPVSQTYMIGDTRSDIRHAKAAGAKAVAVSWGYQPLNALELEGPDGVVRVPRELLSFFGSLDVH